MARPQEALKTFRPRSLTRRSMHVHRADGERLAVMVDQDSAYAAAVANELAPVAVH